MKTFKTKLKLNNKQRTRLFKNASVSRFVYNLTLEMQETNYKNGGKFLSDCEILTKNNTSSGIYIIINIKTFKVYVGSSKDVYKRLSNHISNLRHNKHINKYLQYSFNKYSEDSFIALFIEETKKDKESLETAEQYWIDTLNAYNREYGYNNLRKAYSSIGHSMPVDSKLRILRSMRKNWSTNEVRKKEIVERMKGNTFSLGRKLSRTTKEKLSKSHSGEKNSFYGCKHSDKNKKAMSENRPKRPVTNLDTGEIFASIKDASQKYKISKGNISEVCKGKRKTAGGYRWAYK